MCPLLATPGKAGLRLTAVNGAPQPCVSPASPIPPPCPCPPPSLQHRQGHLRLTALNAFESTATAHTYGAAFIATLRWLAELRCGKGIGLSAADACLSSRRCCRADNRAASGPAASLPASSCTPSHELQCLQLPIHSEAPPAAAMPLAFAAGAGLSLGLGAPLQPVSLLLTRGKHCRGDQSYAPIQAALAACFEAFSVPVAAKVTGQGLVLHADAFALTAWLATPSAAALLSPLDAAAAASTGRDSSTSTAGSVALSGALLADDVAADMQCSKAFAAVLEFEASHGMGSNDLLASSPQAAALRQSLISSIVTLAASLGVQVRSCGLVLGGVRGACRWARPCRLPCHNAPCWVAASDVRAAGRLDQAPARLTLQLHVILRACINN